MVFLANYVTNIKTILSFKNQVQNFPQYTAFFNNDVFFYPLPQLAQQVFSSVLGRVTTTGDGGHVALSKRNFIFPIKRDRKGPWPIVKRQKFFVAHVKTSWFAFQRADSM